MRIQMEMNRIWKAGNNGLVSYESHKESSMENTCRKSTPHATVCHWQHGRGGGGVVGGEGCQWVITLVSFSLIFHFFFQPPTSNMLRPVACSRSRRAFVVSIWIWKEVNWKRSHRTARVVVMCNRHCVTVVKDAGVIATQWLYPLQASVGNNRLDRSMSRAMICREFTVSQVKEQQQSRKCLRN